MKACVRRHFLKITTWNDSNSLLSRPTYTEIAADHCVEWCLMEKFPYTSEYGTRDVKSRSEHRSFAGCLLNATLGKGCYHSR